MRTNELWNLDIIELSKRVGNLKKVLFNLRFQHEIDQLENPKKISHVKKNIARLNTVLVAKNKLT